MADTKNTSAVAPSDAHLNALNQETDYSAGMHDGFDADGGAGTTANGDADSPFGGSSSRPAAPGGGPGARTGAPKNSALVTVQPLQKKDMQPSYAQDLGTDELGMGFYGSLINCLGAVAGGLGQFPCCPCPNPFKSVEQGSVGLVSRFGKFYKAVDPGLVKINPCSENLRRVNVKIQLSNIPRQTVMTKDNVNVQIDSVLYWHISNPYSATFGINDVTSALIERAQTTLRDVVGSRNLQSVIADREGVALQVEEIVESVAERWGVTVESILIKDIVFSKELQESLSSAATQTRIGQSKVIAARAEVDAAKLMRQAADVLSSKAALQLRELDALQAMAKSANSKVIFVPVHLQSGAAGGASGPAAIAGGSGSGTAAGDPSTAAASGQGAGGVFNAAQLNEMANM